MECYLLIYFIVGHTFMVYHIIVVIVVVAVVVIIVVVTGGAIPLMNTKSTLFASFAMFIIVYLSQVSH